MTNTAHFFDVEDAVKYGVDEAVFLANIKHWCFVNKANEKNIFDGRAWTYNSKKAFAKIFPYWTEKQIKRIINKLIKAGAIIKANHNKNPYDRTLWYAPNDESSIGDDGPKDWTKRTNVLGERVQPIPDNKPDNKPDIVNAAAQKQKNIDDFVITEPLRKWGEKEGYDIELHYEHFKDSVRCQLRKPYKDLEAAYRKCVREDWGGLRKQKQFDPKKKRDEERRKYYGPDFGF